MLLPGYRVNVRWRTRLAPALEARVIQELEGASWSMSEMEALLHDAHRATGLNHAWMAPSLVLRMPLFDMGRRFKIQMSRHDKSHIVLLDEDDKKLADVNLE